MSLWKIAAAGRFGKLIIGQKSKNNEIPPRFFLFFLFFFEGASSRAKICGDKTVVFIQDELHVKNVFSTPKTDPSGMNTDRIISTHEGWNMDGLFYNGAINWWIKPIWSWIRIKLGRYSLLRSRFSPAQLIKKKKIINWKGARGRSLRDSPRVYFSNIWSRLGEMK